MREYKKREEESSRRSARRSHYQWQSPENDFASEAPTIRNPQKKKDEEEYHREQDAQEDFPETESGKHVFGKGSRLFFEQQYDSEESGKEHSESGPDADDLTGKLTLVRMKSTLYAFPSTALGVCYVQRNTEVKVIRDRIDKDWAEVQIVGGRSGFINRNYLLQRETSLHPGTRLHRVKGPDLEPLEYDAESAFPLKEEFPQPKYEGIIRKDGRFFRVKKAGETLEEIMKEAYPNLAGEVLDFRTVANVIQKINQGNPAIYVEEGGLTGIVAEEIGHNYNRIKLRADHDLLLPSWETIMQLKDVVPSGSISTGLVQQFWPDGWGCVLSGSACATFIAPTLGGELDIYFFRKGNNLFIHAMVKGEGGIRVGAGAGVSVGKKGARYGAGFRAAADAEAMGHKIGLLEFEIPMRAGMVVNYLKDRLASAFASNAERQEATEAMTRSFTEDILQYIHKVKVESGGRVAVNAGAGVSVSKPGNNADTRDLGNGIERRSQSGTVENRVSQDRSVSPYRSTIGRKYRQLRKEGVRGLTREIVIDFINTLTSFANISGGAEAGYAYGLEYGKTSKGQPQISFFMEGHAWAELDLPMLAPGRLGGGLGGRLNFVYQRSTGRWHPAMPELYAFGGDLDKYAGNAFELSVEMGQPAGTPPEDELLERLKTVKFRKRFLINLSTKKLALRKRGLKRFRALMSSDGSIWGLESKVALTVDLDLSRIDDTNQEIRSDLAALVEGTEGTDSERIIEIIRGMISDNGNSAGVNLLSKLLSDDTISQCTLHAEGMLGIAFSGKIGAGAKAQLDVAGGAGIMYEKGFAGKKLAQVLDEVSNAFNGNESAGKVLAHALNGHNESKETYAAEFIGVATESDLL